MSEKSTPVANLTAATDVDNLISEGKLLRILHPTIKGQVQQALQRGDLSPYVVEDEGHLYISLTQVADEKERDYFYRLIQRYQSGEPVNLKALPPTIQHILQPELTRMGRMLGAVLLGAVAGIAVGVLAMALTILIVDVVTWLTNRPVGVFAGMELTAVSFVVFTFVGWAAAGILAWCKPHLWGNLSASAENLRRKHFSKN